jgi:hypothetical protein
VEHAPGCRIAFHGRVARVVRDPAQRVQLKIHKTKTKQGVVKRVTDAYTVLVRGLCSKTTDISLFINLTVTLRLPAVGGEASAAASAVQQPPIVGHIEGTFGTSGLVKCVFRDGHGLEVTPAGKRKGKGKNKDDEEEEETAGPGSGAPVVALAFKKYIFEKERRIIQ